MRHNDRTKKIVATLKRRVTTAETFAQRFGVSCRTIYRDIAMLKAAGKPIEGEPGLGYGLRRSKTAVMATLVCKPMHAPANTNNEDTIWF